MELDARARETISAHRELRAIEASLEDHELRWRLISDPKSVLGTDRVVIWRRKIVPEKADITYTKIRNFLQPVFERAIHTPPRWSSTSGEVMKGFVASRCLFALLVTVLVGVGTSPVSQAGVQLISVGIAPSNPLPPPPPPPGTIPLAMDGTQAANPLPAIPAVNEYSRLIRARGEVSSLDDGLLGESVDLFTGETDFVATDVSLPGNNALPVAVGRRYQVRNRSGGILDGAFGDWDIDLPHVEGVFAAGVGWTVPGQNPGARCSYFEAPPPATVTTPSGATTVTTTVPASQYTQGFTAVIPGLGRHELLLRDPNSPAPGSTDNPVTTKELWAIRCPQRVGAGPAPDEGFEITTPDGIKYTFDQAFQRPYYPLKRPADTTTSGVEATVDRIQYWLMPSKIQDRYGNWVNYTYDRTTNEQIILKKIESSDNRTITLTYTSGRVSQISDGSNTWTYSYGSFGRLTGVAIPDGTSWDINLQNLFDYQWSYNAPSCTNLPSPQPSNQVSGTLRHPSGASGTFTFAPTRHGRSGAPTDCLRNSANVAFARNEPDVYDTLSLLKKEISGPNLPSTRTWSVTYDGCTSSSCSLTQTTTVKNPLGFNTAYTFGAQYGEDGNGNEGMLLSLKTGGSGSSYARTEEYTYYNASGNPYPSVIGLPAQVRGDSSQLSSLRPVKSRKITQDGTSFTRTLSNPDRYGFSQTITRTGSETKTDTITYRHNTTDWVLGTTQKISSGGKDEVSYDLNSHNQPTTLRRFGRTHQTFGYYSDGTLNWVKDGAGNQVAFSNYRRGIPQNVTYAGGANDGFVVSNLGTITSHTNTMGHTTSYGYDALGRLKSISPPGGYADTSITWGLGTSGWTRGVSTGNATTTTTYDAFLRPVRTTDSLSRNVTRAFDANGNPTFVSYPGSSANGFNYTYDALGRVLTEKDGLGNSKSWSYDANKITVTDRNNRSTGYTYVSYDEPNTTWPLTISTPEYTTRIERDIWRKPKNVIRGSVTRRLSYDTNELLSTIDEPETGVTTITYDSANNIWTINRAGEVTETRTYDGRNRPKQITYSDSTPTITLTWRNDSQPDSESRGSTRRVYEYDSADLLTKERVTVDGATYTIGYDYDTNQNLTTLTYPDDTTIAYAPDAFGRPGKVGSYATGIAYYANDAVSGFTFGNGIAHSLAQDGRLLPSVAADTGVLRSTYSYDGNGNPIGISDSVNSAYSRTLTYDGVNRLLTAAGPWGSSTFTYDGLDNLTNESGGNGASLPIGFNNKTGSVTAGGSTLDLTWDSRGRLTQKGAGGTARRYTFDGTDRLTKLTQGSNTWTYTYDARGYRATNNGPNWNVATVYDRNGRLLYEANNVSPGGDVIFKSGFERPAAPTTYTKYVYLNRHLVAQVDKNGTTTRTQYVHSDALGTSLARTDENRAIVGTSTRLAYGGLFASTGVGDEIGPAYAGHYADDTGLIYMQQRYYDPQLRRFISSDPVRADTDSGLTFNRYAYALNSPYGNVDPDGREAMCVYTDGGCNGPSSGEKKLEVAVGNLVDAVQRFTDSDAGGEMIANVGMLAAIAAAPITGSPNSKMVEREVAEVNALNARALRLQQNAAQGKAGEAVTRATLGDRVAGEQVTFRTSDGTRTRADFVTVDKGVVETKTGEASLSPGQKKLKSDIEAGRAVTPVGENARNADLPPGKPVVLTYCTVDYVDC